ncbi:MAG: helix-turn-helix domain-containing protein [Limibaculum sp.]
MKFSEILGRTRSRELSQGEAASVLGVSERTFRRWRERYDAEGAEGLYDRRLGRVSSRRAPVDEVMRVLELFDTRYWDFTAKHFHEKLAEEHGLARSYNWVRLTLQSHGRKRPAARRGAHRRKRPEAAFQRRRNCGSGRQVLAQGLSRSRGIGAGWGRPRADRSVRLGGSAVCSET